MASNQPEFTSTTSQYLFESGDVCAYLRPGRRMLRHACCGCWSAISYLKYGVDRHILLAIWAMESNFGRTKDQWATCARSPPSPAARATKRPDDFRAEADRGAQDPRGRHDIAPRRHAGAPGPAPWARRSSCRRASSNTPGRRRGWRRASRHLALGRRTRWRRRRITWRSRAGRRHGHGAGKLRCRKTSTVR